MHLHVILNIIWFIFGTLSYKIDYNEANWIAFKQNYNKSYSSATEELKRRLIFHSNDGMIKEHNGKANNGEYSYWLKMTQFGDIDDDEFGTLFSAPREQNDCKWHPASEELQEQAFKEEVPEAFDWRPTGAVTYVKDMRRCSASYAFATTGTLEGQMYLKYGRSLNLSAQQIIDCSAENLGCRGGRADASFRYIFINGGLDKADTYPYLGYKGQCHFDPANVGVKEHGYVNLPRGDLKAVQVALFNIGPLASSMDARGKNFKFYSHGIYEDPDCDPVMIILGVLVVGYTEDAWILRLPFGETFGEQGYMRVGRKTNQCGVATCAEYPIMYDKYK